MGQVAERGIVLDRRIIGRRLTFQAQLIAIKGSRLLLRDVREGKGRFFRDHLWLETDVSRVVGNNGYIHFTGRLSIYHSRSLSFYVNEGWTSIRLPYPVRKYEIKEVKLLKNDTGLTFPLLDIKEKEVKILERTRTTIKCRYCQESMERDELDLICSQCGG